MPSEDSIPAFDIVIVPSYERQRIARLGMAGYCVVATTSIPVSRLVFNRVSETAFEATEIQPALVLQRVHPCGRMASHE